MSRVRTGGHTERANLVREPLLCCGHLGAGKQGFVVEETFEPMLTRLEFHGAEKEGRKGVSGQGTLSTGAGLEGLGRGWGAGLSSGEHPWGPQGLCGCHTREWGV